MLTDILLGLVLPTNHMVYYIATPSVYNPMDLLSEFKIKLNKY